MSEWVRGELRRILDTSSNSDHDIRELLADIECGHRCAYCGSFDSNRRRSCQCQNDE